MSRSVHVNDASIRQLTYLLRLTPGEVQSVVAARPFERLEQLHAVLPEQARAGCVSLRLLKRNLNLATASELMCLVPLRPAQVARLRASRPIKSPDVLRRLPCFEDETLQRLLELYSVEEDEREGMTATGRRALELADA